VIGADTHRLVLLAKAGDQRAIEELARYIVRKGLCAKEAWVNCGIVWPCSVCPGSETTVWHPACGTRSSVCTMVMELGGCRR
jgi:hypothetical protein